MGRLAAAEEPTAPAAPAAPSAAGAVFGGTHAQQAGPSFRMLTRPYASSAHSQDASRQCRGSVGQKTARRTSQMGPRCGSYTTAHVGARFAFTGATPNSGLAGHTPSTRRALSAPAMLWQRSSFRKVTSCSSAGGSRGKNLSGTKLASRSELITAQGVQAPSSSGPHPAPAGPASTRGTSCCAMVAFKPSMTLTGHAGPDKQLQNFTKCGRGSPSNPSVLHRTEPLTCRSIDQSAVHEWSAAVPVQLQVPPSAEQRCQPLSGLFQRAASIEGPLDTPSRSRKATPPPAAARAGWLAGPPARRAQPMRAATHSAAAAAETRPWCRLRYRRCFKPRQAATIALAVAAGSAAEALAAAPAAGRGASGSRVAIGGTSPWEGPPG